MNTEYPILTAEALAVGYKEKHKNINTLIDDINLKIMPGDFVCLIGPNGCGKSTLLRTLAGIQKPLKGKINIDGLDPAESPRDELSRKTSIVLTENFSIVNTSVRSIVSLGRSPYSDWLGILRNNDFAAIDDAIEAAGLSQYKDKNIMELSDGTRQKVMIARALAQDTPLMLLDEPTAYLDAPSKLEIIHMLRSLSRKFNKTVILSSHDLELVLQSADAVILITNNKKIEVNTPEDLVLNGHFEEAFNKNDVKFSLQQGIFKMNSSENIALKITGNRTESFWTERALARMGISAAREGNGDGIVSIETREGVTEWRLSYNSKEEVCYSIGRLLEHLKAFSK